MSEFLAGVKWLLSLTRTFLASRDMKALYWYSSTQFVAAGGDLLIRELTSWDPDNMLTVAVGLVLSRITKHLNKKANAKRT